MTLPLAIMGLMLFDGGKKTLGNDIVADLDDGASNDGFGSRHGGGQSNPRPQSSTPTPSSPSMPTFPWPPPPWSTGLIVEEVRSANVRTMGDLAAELQAGLSAQGYDDRSFRSAPNGFALATRVERILSDGTPAEDRWIAAEPERVETLSSLFNQIFFAPVGRYRVLVFILSTDPFMREPNATTTAAEATAWAMNGMTRLPPEMSDLPLLPQHGLTALIYEFERTADDAEVLLPSPLTARRRLAAAGLGIAIDTISLGD